MSHVKRTMMRRGCAAVRRDAEYIVRRAQQRDSRVVALGEIVLFSTETGDAWLLDTEDGLARCLARDGERQEYTIAEAPSGFAIEWNAQYEIRGEFFTVVTKDGRISTILGYPTDEIEKASKGL